MMINSDRIQRTLADLSQFGALEGGGTTRISYSKDYLAAQEYVRQAMLEAGMTVERDPIGNLIGTYAGTDGSLPAVMSGSHLDTVPGGGNFDGVLGVVAALEVARSWHDAGYIPKRSLKVIATIEEESTDFGQACFGVRVRSGEFKDAKASDIKCVAQENAGKTLADRLNDAGFPADALQSAAVGFSDISAFIELHIEQGAQLDEKHCQCGIVTHIVGYDRLYITLLGEANHAGTTAMHRRKDAAAAGAEIILGVQALAQADKRFVATCGKFDVEPGAANIVPGKVHMCVEVRSYDDAILQEVRQKVLDVINRGTEKNNVKWQIDGDFHVPAVPLYESVISCMEEAARELDLQHRQLPSWAGHDAQIFVSAGVPTGMIFVPSVNGISHAKAEYSRPEEIACCVQLLEKVLEKLTQK